MPKRLIGRGRYVAGLGFLILFGALAWHLFAHPGDRRDLAWARLMAEGDIRVGVDPSYPPFEFEDQSSAGIKGYDVDLANEIAKRLGVRATFVHVGFDSLYDTLRSGKIDAVISGMPYDPNMTEDYSYGVWYFNAGQYLAVRADDGAILSQADLNDKRLAVELGSTGDLEGRRLQKQVEGLILRTYGSADEALNALMDSKADAALVDAVSEYLFMAGGHSIRLEGDPVLDESYAVVTNRRSTSLRSAIDQTIRAMKSDGFLDAIRDRWLLGKSG